MAARFWVGGSGTWDNSSTTNWSTTSGGASGASAPVLGDTVTFNVNSNVGTNPFTVTLGANVRATSMSISGLDGALTFAPAGFTMQMNSISISTATVDLGSMSIYTASWTNAATGLVTATNATLYLNTTYSSASPSNSQVQVSSGTFGTINVTGNICNLNTGTCNNLIAASGSTLRMMASSTRSLLVNTAMTADGVTFSSQSAGTLGFMQCNGTASLIGSIFQDFIAAGTSAWFSTGGQGNGNVYGVSFVGEEERLPATMANDAAAGTGAWSNTAFTQYSPQTRWSWSGSNVTGYKDHTVQLIKGGSFVGSNKALTGTVYPTSAANSPIYGSPFDLWGTTLTPTDVNASNFGVAIRSQDSAALAGQYLKVTNAGFAVPSTATIIGVEVVINRYQNASPWKVNVQGVFLKVYYTLNGQTYTSVYVGTGANDASSGSNAWSNPTNIQADDASYATANGAYDSGTDIRENRVALVLANGTFGTNKEHGSSGGATLPTAAEKIYFGGPSDLWGATLAPADVNDVDFGAIYQPVGSPSTIQVLKGTNLGLAIASGATIDGVMVEVERYQVGGNSTFSVGYVDYMRLHIFYTAPTSNNYTSTLTDSMTMADVVSKGAGRLLADSMTMADTIVRGAGKVLVDSMTMADSFVRDGARALVDSITMSDAFTSIKAQFKTLTDSLTMSDTLTRSLGVSRVLTDSMTMADAFIRGAGKVLADSLTMADSIVRAGARAFTDVLTMTATFISASTLARTLTDAMTMADTFLKNPARSFADALTMAESFTATKVALKVLTDSLTMAEQFFRQGAVYLEDVMTMTDSFVRAGARAFTDALTMTAVLIKSPARLFMDSMTMTDVFLRAMTKTLLETLTMTAVFIRASSRLFTDSMTMTASLIKGTAKTFAEAMTMTDTFLRSMAKLLSDSMTMTATFVSLSTLSRVFTDSMTMADVLLKATGRLLSDAMTLTDTFLRAVGRRFTDAMTMADDFLPIFGRTFSDSLTMADTMVRASARVFLESLTMTETFVRASAKTFADSMTMTAVFLRNSARTFADSMTMTDTFTRLVQRFLVLTDHLTMLARFTGRILNYVKRSPFLGGDSKNEAQAGTRREDGIVGSVRPDDSQTGIRY